VSLLETKVGSLLGDPVVRTEPVAGGDINNAYAFTLASGQRVFAKSHRAALPEMFVREAEGLAWLAEPNAVRVPKVLAASDADDAGPACLVLEYIARGSADENYAEILGQGLAALHRAGAPGFGHAHARPNYLATLPQDNTAEPTWAAFYVERRLKPLLDRARGAEIVPSELAARVRRVCDRMPSLIGPEEPPARVHGDLWGGNCFAADSGEPVLIDPAVYGGHREIDLAMMRLFGGFPRRAFDAYNETYPLQPGHEGRVALYQLYPLLAHVNLFGASYLPQLDRALAHYM